MKRHEICSQCEKGYPISSHKDPTALHKRCEEWNKTHPIGTWVEYCPVVTRGQPSHGFTWERVKTRTEAWVLGEHTAVVSIERTHGAACSLDHFREVK